MFREGAHRARFKRKDCLSWFEGMVEYVSDSYIYLYTNSAALDGTKSDNFIKNSYGYKYCFHSSTKYLENVIYTDHNYIGEL